MKKRGRSEGGGWRGRKQLDFINESHGMSHVTHLGMYSGGEVLSYKPFQNLPGEGHELVQASPLPSVTPRSPGWTNSMSRTRVAISHPS